MIPFTKMEAQGNDFVIVDGRSTPLPTLNDTSIRTLCDRRLGIGCDQLLLLADHPEADCAMRIFNNDGSEAANCGNGARCVADLLLREACANRVRIAIADRILQAERDGMAVAVAMGSATISDHTSHHAEITIGNRHRVYFDATETIDPTINIEIITGYGDDHLWIDIIERGAGHTPACGSGACATAVAWWQRQQRVMPLTIVMPGGEVTVSGSADNLRLSGSVRQVFQGKIDHLDLAPLC